MEEQPTHRSAGGFPATHVSAVARSASDDRRVRRAALEEVLSAYWAPARAYLRLRWRAPAADADDLTQGFFAHAMEKGFFARFDPARGRFRSFLRIALDGYVQNERAALARLKRGGGAQRLSLEETAEPADARDPERLFHREWTRELFEVALARLREGLAARRREADYELLRRHDLEPESEPGGAPTYEALAGALGLSLSQVANRLSGARAELRRLVRARLSEVCASEEEARLEARELFGAEP